MREVEVTTQQELDQALAAGHYPILRSGYYEIFDSASVRAFDSASVTASGSASVRAYDSVSVRASGSASVSAYGSASVRASGSASVRASSCVAIHDHGPDTRIKGGVVIPIHTPENGREWCEFYGLKVSKAGRVTLFKAVGDDWKGNTKTEVSYEPGSKPAAPDWHPAPSCGQGLHFSPRPWMAEKYNYDATRYVACPVDVETLVVLDDKVKAPRVVGKIFECDQDGEPLEVKS